MGGESGHRHANRDTNNFSNWDSHDANGFGAPDYSITNRVIDLNEQFIRNKPATFLLRVSGDSMINAGILTGDVLIVDRSLKATSGKIIVAELNGEMLVRRLEKTFNRIRLIPETEKLSTIEVDTSSCEFSIWGVVTFVIHSV